MLGTIFNIQRYSIHDGPGIRTTVFLKGCPLNCQWCHNPEGLAKEPELVYWSSRCLGCLDCLKNCPLDALSYQEGIIGIDKGKCNLCGICADLCPGKALEMVGRKISLEELMVEILKDRIFYEESAGGVTFSGGEPLCQAEFLKEVLLACGAQGLHRTIDTSGYAPQETLLKIAEWTDLFLYDLKDMNSERHKYYTAVGNELILSNLQAIARKYKNTIVRLPIIPQVNNDEANIKKTGEFLTSLGLKEVHLLPYHRMAQEKYSRLGREYLLGTLAEPTKEMIEKVKAILLDYHLSVSIRA